MSEALTLRAFHRPNVGQYGACTRCTHGDTTGLRCTHPMATSFGGCSQTMRSQVCLDGSLHQYQPPTPQHAAQTNLLF